MEGEHFFEEVFPSPLFKTLKRAGIGISSWEFSEPFLKERF